MKFKKSPGFWISILLNLILILTIIIFVLKYQVEENFSDQIYYQETSKDSINFFWPPNKQMALSLTFDDAKVSQIDSGIPILNKYNVKGTFYVSPDNLGVRLQEWKDVVKNGHEIGNHSTKHPCSINFGFQHMKSLENITLTEMKDDLTTENQLIRNLLGVQPVSFAYPCGETTVGQGLNTRSYVPIVSSIFESGRLSSVGGYVNPVYSDLSQLPSAELDHKTFHEIKELIDEGKKTGKWLILSTHEVGDGYDGGYESLVTSKSTLDSVCKYANDPSNGIWIDNVTNITCYIKEKRGEKPFIHLAQYKKPTSSLYSKVWSLYYIWKIRITHYSYVIKKKLNLI
jgi:peptidoglycan/xylan/chitin deacetylase (PgdA/CDA1 family)